jgi:hypothetical protein
MPQGWTDEHYSAAKQRLGLPEEWTSEHVDLYLQKTSGVPQTQGPQATHSGDGDDVGPGLGRAFLHGIQYDTPEALIYRYGKGMALEPDEDDYNIAEQVARGLGSFVSPTSILLFIAGGGLGGGVAKKLGVDGVKRLVVKKVIEHGARQAGAVGLERMGRDAIEQKIKTGEIDVNQVLTEGLKGAGLGLATGPAAALGPAGRTLQAAAKGSRKGASTALTEASAALEPKFSLMARPGVGVASRLSETAGSRVANAARRGLQGGTEGAIFGVGGPLMEGQSPTGEDIGTGVGTMLALTGLGALGGRMKGTHGKALSLLRDHTEGKKVLRERVKSAELDALLAREPAGEAAQVLDPQARRRLPPKTELADRGNPVPPPRGSSQWPMDRSVLEKPAEFAGELQNIVTEFQVWGERTGRLRPDQVRFLDKVANDAAGMKWLSESDASTVKSQLVDVFGIQRWRQFLLDNRLRPDELQKGAGHLEGELPLPDKILPNRYDQRLELTKGETRADNDLILDSFYEGLPVIDKPIRPAKKSIGHRRGEWLGEATPVNPEHGQVVRGADGALLGYHGGSADLNLKDGKPFHLGTEQAAIDRITRPEVAGGGSTIQEIGIRPKKPYRVLDERDGGERTELFLLQNDPKARKALTDQGYDVVPYINAIEGPGSLSYLVLDPKIVEFTGQSVSGRVAPSGKWQPISTGGFEPGTPKRTRTAEQMNELMDRAARRGESDAWRKWADKHRTDPDLIDEAIRLMDESFEGTIGNTTRGALSVVERLSSMTTKTGEKDTGLLARQGGKIRAKAEKAYVRFMDDIHALRRFEEAVQKETGYALPAEMRPYLMGRLARSYTGRAAERIRLNLDPILKGMDDGMREEFKSLLRAERFLDRWGEFKNNESLRSKGLTHGVLLRHRETLGPKYATQLEAYKKMMTDMLYDSVGKERADVILEKNGFYTPLFAEMEAAMYGKNTGDPKAYSSPDIIKPIEGKGDLYMDPLEATIKNIYMSERYRAHRHTVEAVIELDRLAGGTGMIKPTKAAPSQHNRVLEHWEGLEKKYYEVDPDIYEAFINLDRAQMSILSKVLGAPARTLRIGATSTLSFGIRNALRDWWVNSIQSTYGFTPFDLIKGVTSVMRKDKWYTEFMESGGAMSSAVAMDHAGLHKAVNKSIANTGKGGAGKALYYLKHPIEFGRMFTEFSEAFNRVGTYRKARKYTGRYEAALEAREVTLDFSRAGTWGKHINSVVAFWNAQVQGADKMRRVAQERPESFMARTAPIAISSMALVLWNRQDPRWKDIPDYEKRANWIFMMPGVDKIWKMTKPFDYGMLYGSVPELFVESTLDRNPDAASDLWDMISSVTPSLNPMDLTIVTPIAEILANKSFFKDRPIVPRSQEDLWPHLQFGRYTGRTSKEFTKGMARIWGEEHGYSPRYMEHLWKGYTGGLGKLAMQAIDVAWDMASPPDIQLGAKVWHKDLPVMRDFDVRHPSQGGQFVSDFYDLGYEARSALASAEESGQRPERWARRVDAIYSATRNRMNKFQKKIQRIDENNLMGGKAKNEAYDEVYEKINRTAERAYLRMLEARWEE